MAADRATRQGVEAASHERRPSARVTRPDLAQAVLGALGALGNDSLGARAPFVSN